MNIRKLITTTLLVTGLALSGTATAQEKVNINVGIINADGVCGVQYPLGEGNMKLELTVRASDLNAALAVQNVPGEIVNANIDKENVPVTLTFDGSDTSTADVGVYQAGFHYRVAAYWSDNQVALGTLDKLAEAQTIAVSFDGYSYGPVALEPVGFGYNYILNCLRDNGLDI